MSKKAAKKKKRVLLITIAVASVLAAVVLVLLLKNGDRTLKSQEIDGDSVEDGMEASNPEDDLQNLGNDLCIVEIGGYSGQYVEDGSDESVSDVLMMRVANRSDEPVEYAVIQLPVEDTIAEFTVSALMPGAEAILLEKNRMTYDPAMEYTNVATLANYAKYQYELELYEDKVDIQVLDGAVNVTNISGDIIPENVTIYYKNKENGVFLGGIAYRITIEGGIGIGEIRQKMATHLSEDDSGILFVTMTE